jgi:tetratricopeptide (TPR) repeat protein/tRNA A-37 threonylcarbamoyl transferase component Bud32
MTSGPSDWEQADRLLDAALDRPAAERPRFLDEACGGDAALRSRVERLLAGAETLDAFLAPGGALAAVGGLDDPDAPVVPRYRLGPEIGRGGMAVVHQAERADGLFEHRVAVKLVKRGSDTDEVLRRFEQERRILASLDHPDIARLLDGGAAEDGRPFFAMELVVGQPIDAWCDARRLAIPERLRLFVRVARAVEHAHRKLVVHRDLKPSNILVTAEGHPKLLDFGIAKLLEEGGGPDITGRDVRVLTPAYASPEQVKGEGVTTASDVYQLGLLLHVLLAGRHPYRDAGDSPQTVVRAILEAEDAPRPSAVVRSLPLPEAEAVAAARGTTPRRLARALAGDLDTIVGAAARKDPARRYGGVGPLVDDVLRHLGREPVQARGRRPGYAVVRFVERHWLLASVSAVAIGGVAAGALVAERHARRADRRFQEVRRLARALIFDLDQRIAPLPGSTPARQFAVATSLSYLDGLLLEADGDPELLLELAEAYERVADVQGHPRSPNLGQPHAALRGYERALELRGRVGPRPDQVTSRARLQTRRADVLETEGRLSEARVALEDASAALRRLLPSEPDAPRLLAETMTSLGVVHARGNDAAAALAAHRGALAAAAEWERRAPGLASRRALAMAEARVANALSELGDLDASLAGHRRAAEALEVLARDAPDDQGLRRDLRLVTSWLGNVQGVPSYLNLGDTSGAVRSYRRALAMSDALAAADPLDARARLDALNARWRLASLLADDAPAEARALVEEALAGLAALREEAPEAFDLARRHAAVRLTLADVHIAAGRPEPALAVLREARQAAQSLTARAPADIGLRALRRSLWQREGDLLRRAGDLKAARTAHERALELARAWADERPDDPYALWALADTCAALARDARALADDATRPPAVRRQESQAAVAWQRRSVEVWQDWPRRAVTSAFDRDRLGRARRDLAAYERPIVRDGVAGPAGGR